MKAGVGSFILALFDKNPVVDRENTKLLPVARFQALENLAYEGGLLPITVHFRERAVFLLAVLQTQMYLHDPSVKT